MILWDIGFFYFRSLTSTTTECECECVLCVSPATVSVCGFCMNLYFIKISSASFNEWLFPLCAVELLKFSVRSCQFCLGRCSTCLTKASPMQRGLLCSICIWIRIPAAAAAARSRFFRNFSEPFHPASRRAVPGPVSHPSTAVWIMALQGSNMAYMP